MFRKAALFLGGMVSGAAVCLAAAAFLPYRELDIDLSDLDLSQSTGR